MNQQWVEEFTSDHKHYKKIFEGNKQFIQDKLQEDSQYFVKLSKGQQPKYLIIGCSDSRVPPNDLTKTQPGDIFNHRNIANQVILADVNVHSVIQYAIEHLKVKHVIVMGHTKCGGIRAAIEGQSHGGLLDLWISHIKNVHEKYSDELALYQDMDDKVNRLCELNVVEQVMNCWKNSYIQKSWLKGQPVWVHGWIFRVETGELEEIVVDKDMPDLKMFKFNFTEDHHKEQSNLPQHSTLPQYTPEDHIWRFDEFLHAQSEFMHRQDPIGEHTIDHIENKHKTIRRSQTQDFNFDLSSPSPKK